MKALCQGSKGKCTKEDSSREVEPLGRAEGMLVFVAQIHVAVAILELAAFRILAHLVAVVLSHRGESLWIVCYV